MGRRHNKCYLGQQGFKTQENFHKFSIEFYHRVDYIAQYLKVVLKTFLSLVEFEVLKPLIVLLFEANDAVQTNGSPSVVLINVKLFCSRSIRF